MQRKLRACPTNKSQQSKPLFAASFLSCAPCCSSSPSTNSGFTLQWKLSLKNILTSTLEFAPQMEPEFLLNCSNLCGEVTQLSLMKLRTWLSNRRINAQLCTELSVSLPLLIRMSASLQPLRLFFPWGTNIRPTLTLGPNSTSLFLSVVYGADAPLGRPDPGRFITRSYQWQPSLEGSLKPLTKNDDSHTIWWNRYSPNPLLLAASEQVILHFAQDASDCQIMIWFHVFNCGNINYSRTSGCICCSPSIQ